MADQRATRRDSEAASSDTVHDEPNQPNERRYIKLLVLLVLVCITVWLVNGLRTPQSRGPVMWFLDPIDTIVKTPTEDGGFEVEFLNPSLLRRHHEPVAVLLAHYPKRMPNLDGANLIVSFRPGCREYVEDTALVREMMRLFVLRLRAQGERIGSWRAVDQHARIAGRCCG